LEAIFADTRKPFTCFLTDVALTLRKSKQELQVCVEALTADIKAMRKKMQEDKTKIQVDLRQQEAQSFWEKVSLFITTGVGAGAAIGTVFGPAGTAAGAVLGSSAVAAIIAGTTAVGGVVGGAVGAAANKICNIQ